MSVTRVSTERGTGAAGRRGEGIRSDLWVQVETRDEGGIELMLTSRVDPYFGESLRAQTTSLLQTLGIPHARVDMEDMGALPFVVAARLEAAARAAGVAPAGDTRPERAVPLPPPTTRRRLRRSRLYLPGNEPKFFMSAGLYDPDAIILDLEDSVHPDHKAAARILVRNALRAVDFRDAERMVRINQLPLGLEDLAAVVPEQPDVILIPKVETAGQVEEVASVVDATLGAQDLGRPIWLMPIVESALGIENAFEIARASDRVVALTIGLEDYAADIGVPRSPDGVESMWARRRIVNAAKAAGLQAIDSVYSQVDDVEGLKLWGERSKSLGFEGMGCIHPRQIAVIHEAFKPAAEQIEKALRIVEAYAEAQKQGHGVVSLGSKMIDPPVVHQALALVKQARMLGLIPGETGREAD